MIFFCSKHLPANRRVSIDTGRLDILILLASSCWVILITFWLNWALLSTGSTAGIPKKRLKLKKIEMLKVIFFLKKSNILDWFLPYLNFPSKMLCRSFQNWLFSLSNLAKTEILSVRNGWKSLILDLGYFAMRHFHEI